MFLDLNDSQDDSYKLVPKAEGYIVEGGMVACLGQACIRRGLHSQYLLTRQHLIVYLYNNISHLKTVQLAFRTVFAVIRHIYVYLYQIVALRFFWRWK